MWCVIITITIIIIGVTVLPWRIQTSQRSSCRSDETLLCHCHIVIASARVVLYNTTTTPLQNNGQKTIRKYLEKIKYDSAVAFGMWSALWIRINKLLLLLWLLLLLVVEAWRFFISGRTCQLPHVLSGPAPCGSFEGIPNQLKTHTQQIMKTQGKASGHRVITLAPLALDKIPHRIHNGKVLWHVSCKVKSMRHSIALVIAKQQRHAHGK